jgi:DNA-binding Xre family transcriptional regulator
MIKTNLFKEQIAKHNLSTKQASEELGICMNTLRDFLNGKNVRMAVVDKICTKWGLQPKDIISYEKDE